MQPEAAQPPTPDERTLAMLAHVLQLFHCSHRLRRQGEPGRMGGLPRHRPVGPPSGRGVTFPFFSVGQARAIPGPGFERPRCPKPAPLFSVDEREAAL
jgi:hypothetical protein